jgi:hypothetical protein
MDIARVMTSRRLASSQRELHERRHVVALLVVLFVYTVMFLQRDSMSGDTSWCCMCTPNLK